MNDLMRGWDIFWAHAQAHGAIWIAILVPIVTATLLAFHAPRGRRADEQDHSTRPKSRTKLPGPDRGFRP